MNLNEGSIVAAFEGRGSHGWSRRFCRHGWLRAPTSASQELSSTSDSAWDKEVDVVIAGAAAVAWLRLLRSLRRARKLSCAK